MQLQFRQVIFWYNLQHLVYNYGAGKYFSSHPNKYWTNKLDFIW